MFLNNLIVLVCNFCFSNSAYNKANIFLGLIEYELNSLLGASHLVDYISVHIQFDLERYLLIIKGFCSCLPRSMLCCVCFCTLVPNFVSGKQWGSQMGSMHEAGWEVLFFSLAVKFRDCTSVFILVYLPWVNSEITHSSTYSYSVIVSFVCMWPHYLFRVLM